MDAKKKRNKKKKGNQPKNGDETISSTEDSIVREHGNGSALTEQNQNGKVLVSSEKAPLPEHDKESDKQQPVQNGSVGSGASLLEQDKGSNEKQPFQNGLVSAVPGVTAPEPHKEINKHNMCEEKLVSASTGFSLCFGRF